MHERSRLLPLAAISWLGLLVHNVADLPGQTVVSPETLYPGLVLALILAVHRFGPPRLGAGLLLVWAVLHLVGGGVLSVLPLPILPFAPEQTLRHYTFHLLYALTQLPLLVVALRELRRPPRRGRSVGGRR